MDRDFLNRNKLLRRSGIAIVLIADQLEWQPEVVYQVGVGTRNHEMEVFKVAWPDATYIGFEPNPETVKKIDYPGTLHAIALGDEPGHAMLNSRKRHADGSSLLEIENAHSSVQVAVDTFDNIVPDVPPKAMLWVDCEGYEVKMLNGAKNALACGHVDVVNVEMTAKAYGDGWAEPSEVHAILKSHGYMRQWIHTQRISQGQVDVSYVREELFDPNYCCCPCEVDNYCMHDEVERLRDENRYLREKLDDSFRR